MTPQDLAHQDHSLVEPINNNQRREGFFLHSIINDDGLDDTQHIMEELEHVTEELKHEHERIVNEELGRGTKRGFHRPRSAEELKHEVERLVAEEIERETERVCNRIQVRRN